MYLDYTLIKGSILYSGRFLLFGYVRPILKLSYLPEEVCSFESVG